MTKTLDGILAVSLEQAVAGPVATSRLADAGARVIKLERPGGDFARGYDDYVHGQSSYHVWNNRGKESCTVDLKTEDDRALVEAMLAEADVFLQNLVPGAAGRLGFSAERLRCDYPGLIVCEISGYPPGSPRYDRKAYDLLIQAESGLAWSTGTEASGPSRVGVSICDIITGQNAYAAILEALIRRGRTGEGCHIQLSLFDSIVEFMNVPYLAQRYGGRPPKRPGLAHPSIAPYGVFGLADGEILLAVQNEREWRALCTEVLGDPELAADPRFESNVLRVRNRAELERRLQALLAGRQTDTFAAALDETGIAYGMVSDLARLAAHPSASFLPVETPEGPVELLATPALVDGERVTAGRVPEAGEHTRALRAEFGAAGKRQRA